MSNNDIVYLYYVSLLLAFIGGYVLSTVFSMIWIMKILYKGAGTVSPKPADELTSGEEWKNTQPPDDEEWLRKNLGG